MNNLKAYMNHDSNDANGVLPRLISLLSVMMQNEKKIPCNCFASANLYQSQILKQFYTFNVRLIELGPCYLHSQQLLEQEPIFFFFQI